MTSNPAGEPSQDAEAMIAARVERELKHSLEHAAAGLHFLVDLDDTLRPLSDAEEIAFTAATALGQHLAVNRCAYAIADVDQDAITLTGNYTDGVESVVGRYMISQFSADWLREMRAGEPYVVADSLTDPRITAADRPSYAATEIAAMICVPILKRGQFVAAMAVHSRVPREWRLDEVELVQRVASRCWESIERARVTQNLKDSEQQFRALANSIPNLAWMAKPDGWIYWYNDQWYAYTGTTHADMEGWRWESVHDPAVLPAVKERWQGAIATGEPFEMVFPLRGADGKFRRFLTRVNPVRDSQGEVAHWFGTNTDVETERRATELNAEFREREGRARQEANDLRESAEAANRAKDEFLAMLGHELRNPLSPILTALHLMKLRGSGTVEYERTVIERQVTHLTRLVDDLLDVSRIARGKVVLKRETIELAQVAAKAIEMTSPLLEQRAHTLDLHIPKQGLAVDGDPVRLSQVVSNLLANAAKYTPANGRITMQAAEEAGEVVLRVRDTGIGIAPEILPQVFDLFVQGRQAIDRSDGGLGLGLTIVRNLVKAHGGSVAAHSDGLGRGSEFVVRLKCASGAGASVTATAERQPEVEQPSLATGARVLIVDDNVDGATLLSEVLTLRGYQTRVAHDAPSALKIAAELHPAIAILDLGLPVMDGFELADRLRTMPGLADLRLIALTGYGQEADRERTRRAGFQHHLIKPVDFHVIERALAGAADEGEPVG